MDTRVKISIWGLGNTDELGKWGCPRWTSPQIGAPINVILKTPLAAFQPESMGRAAAPVAVVVPANWAEPEDRRSWVWVRDGRFGTCVIDRGIPHN